MGNGYGNLSTLDLRRQVCGFASLLSVVAVVDGREGDFGVHLQLVDRLERSTYGRCLSGCRHFVFASVFRVPFIIEFVRWYEFDGAPACISSGFLGRRG